MWCTCRCPPLCNACVFVCVAYSTRQQKQYILLAAGDILKVEISVTIKHLATRVVDRHTSGLYCQRHKPCPVHDSVKTL